MTANSQTITMLHDLMVGDARRLISAEVEFKNVLPDWISKAGSVKLKTELLKYANLVQEHIQKPDTFFEEEKISTLSFSGKIMPAFIEDARVKMDACSDAEVRDACLLACIQGINHFKISMYGTAAAFARALSLEKLAAIVYEAEINEKQIGDRLSQLAEHEINTTARSPVVLP